MTPSYSSRDLAGLRATRLAGLALGLSLGLASFMAAAQADKVGVAAAVNPDAFSSLSGTPNKQLSIGKNIFFSERINTTNSGLVQVLLLDGSTFTVGPNSDLVIDKFVYDPKKKTGEMIATFSKGTMRFIGGKLSKNEGGVTVKTPSGALAIRGGMVQATPTKMSFLYGVAMTFTSHNGQTSTVYETGYTLDLSGGTPTIRPTTPQDTNFFMSALSNGTGATGTGGTPAGSTDPNLVQQANNFDEIINEATATQIQDEIQKQIAQLTDGAPTTTTSPGGSSQSGGGGGGTTPEPTTASFGYAGGVFLQTSSDEGDPPVGTLSNLSPTQVGLLFGNTTQAFKGADFKLFVDGGQEDTGGIQLTFVPTSILPVGGPLDTEDSDGIFAGLAGVGIPKSITVFDSTTGEPPDLADPATLNSGAAGLVGYQTGDLLCEDCSFLKFGSWGATANFSNPGAEGANNVNAAGWWVAGDLPTVGDLPTQGTATYSGQAFGMVSIRDHRVWQDPYAAKGKLDMVWSFNNRAGLMAITEFDKNGPRGPLNVAGLMRIPGQLSATDVNQFSGDLKGFLGSNIFNLSKVNGSAVGSFAANGPDKSAAIIGNWNAAAKNYQASGVFGASRNGPIRLPNN